MSRRPNQVSLKDLFTTNPGELLGGRYASDSALDSASQGNSQYLYSQAELFDSQDGQQLPHSQNLSQSPTTRFFNRYMAKGSVIGRDGSQSQIGRTYSAPIAPKLPSQQQIQLLKARTQEHDERDLWNSLVCGIRECSAEVRVAVACLKESTQLGIGSTECQLTTFTEKIQSSLEKSQSVIVGTLSNRDNDRTNETELQQELAIKNARIEELERQIKKMSEEKQDLTVTSLQSTCEDLCRKITESLESFFCRNQDALTRLEVVQEKHNQLAVDQMKQYLQQNFQDQKEYTRSFVEGFKTLNSLQNETMQMQNGMLTSEILKSLHIVQENQLRGFEDLLIHQIKELLEKKELNQKELFEEQYQRLSVIQQEERHEVLKCLQSELQNSSSEQKKQFLNIIENCMSEEKNRCFQLLKELATVDSINKRCGKELDDTKDPMSSKPLLRCRTDVFCPEFAKGTSRNNFPTDLQLEGLQILPFDRKTQPDIPSAQRMKQMSFDGDAKKLPSTASLFKGLADLAPTAQPCAQSEWDKDFTYREAMAQTSQKTSASGTSNKGDKTVNKGEFQMPKVVDPTFISPLPSVDTRNFISQTSLTNSNSNTGYSVGKPVSRGKFQNLPEAVDPKFVSPLPSGNSRSFAGHSYVSNDNKVNPSPVALVIPQVQVPKPLQLDRNNAIQVASLVRSTALTPAHQTGSTMTSSGMKNGPFATPAALPGSIARAKVPITSEVQPSSISRVVVFAKTPTSQARPASMKTPVTKELMRKYEIQQPSSPAGGRKVSKKRRGKWSRASQSRKRARKQPVVEVSISDKHSKSDNRKPVTNSNGKPDKIAAKKPAQKQNVICKVLSPMAEVFDFHSDTSAGSDDESPASNTSFLSHKVQRSTYSKKNLEGRIMTRSSFDVSKRQPTSKFTNFSETCARSGNHGPYSTGSRSVTVGKTGGLPASHKKKGNSTDLRNDNCLERNLISKEDYCSSSASSSPCWSIGDILKLSEV